ncbi:phosphotransferase enzyme family protein [candidate division CSSED10-310 bacterium]|uniref:Phosphotransferase enzyme family protein n=1 Tax=candidate division CSSED10-310 bacterium TaxID=2855610 RepID=A0ABV6Z3A6_UNCC1
MSAQISDIEIAREVIGLYAVGEVHDLEHIVEGLIHKTYRVKTGRGEYALQCLHPVLAHEAILIDYQRVTEHLDAADFPAPRLIAERQDQVWVTDRQNRRWRLTNWLPGKSYPAITSRHMNREAAALLGRFHMVMSTFHHPFLSTHPLHNTEHHLRSLQQASETYKSTPLFHKISPLIRTVTATIPQLLFPPLPVRIVHGDPKISNFLFDEAENATAIIDLDTCSRHTVLVDLGDAMRSWCRQGGEDEEQRFSLIRFEDLLQGYSSSPMTLTDTEIKLLPQAGKLITLELAARFLCDALEDTYFGWDSSRYSSRRDHNVARAKAMLFLARDMAEQEGQLNQLVKKYYKYIQ